MHTISIYFTIEETKKILDGKKTQSRRLIKEPIKHIYKQGHTTCLEHSQALLDHNTHPYKKVKRIRRTYTNTLFVGAYLDCTVYNEEGIEVPFLAFSPYGGPNSYMWIREKFYIVDVNKKTQQADILYPDNTLGVIPMSKKEIEKHYKYINHPHNRHDAYDPDWQSPFYMSAIMSRILLKVNNVYAERLHAISDENLKKEGFETLADFKAHWDKAYHKKAILWKHNPFVWVVDFQIESVKDLHPLCPDPEKILADHLEYKT
jgi:hypothetical protein